MGYLVDQMEKLAKETERSLGDKLALGAGTGAGVLGANAAMNTAAYHALGDSIMPDGSFMQKLRAGIGKNSLDAKLLQSRMENAITQAGKHGGSPLKAGATAWGRGVKAHWKSLPKKVKLLSALGLPVAAAAGYGGYKATDAMLGE